MWSVRFVAVLALLAVLVGGALAATPEFPSRPIRYIAASAPGGASDAIARTIGPALSEGLGVQVIVDNRPGVGNTIGAEIAARAAPDGQAGRGPAGISAKPGCVRGARVARRPGQNSQRTASGGGGPAA